MGWSDWKRRLRHPYGKLASLEQALLLDVTTGAAELASGDLYEELLNLVGPGVHITIADHGYYAPAEATVSKLCRYSGVRRLPYKLEGADCDDFAWALKGRACEASMRSSSPRGLAFGIVTGRFLLGGPDLTEEHAMNWARLADGRFVLVEPQDGRRYPWTPASVVRNVHV